MLFKPEDLMTKSYDPIQEAADILNESVYLDESESILSPVTIPVVENARIGANVVAFADVERLAEDHGADYIEAMQAIAEANEIDMDHLAVSVPEWKIIADPEVVNELSNVIVAPISSGHPIYQFCEACIDTAIEEDDECYLEAMYEVLTSFDEASNKDNPNTGVNPDLRARLAAKKAAGAGSGLAELEAKAKHYEELLRGGKFQNSKGLNATLKRGSEQWNNLNKKLIAVNAQIDAIKGRKGKKNSVADTEKPSPSEQAAANNTGETSRIQKMLDTVKKYGYDTPKEAISRAISSLKTKYQQLKDWVAKTDDQGKRSIFQKFIGLITSAIDKLTGLLSKKDDGGDGKKEEKPA